MDKAPRNRTIVLSVRERKKFRKNLFNLTQPVDIKQMRNRTICQDVFKALEFLPGNFADLVFVDPPYNLNKKFREKKFKSMSAHDYADWLNSWLAQIPRLMKKNASIYICGDWKSSSAIEQVAQKYFHIQNRITFEREKGRGAKANWKNSSEDIWFCTLSEKYFFDVNAVKVKRKVLAPYRDHHGKPKDWQESDVNAHRLTHPSNLWTDITIPFWSMPENTEHPTQKPEKLLAKIILASSQKGDMVFDPFLGSGTTSVVAKKLGRNYLGIEQDEYYACLAEKRLELAGRNTTIQGYEDGVFWERNAKYKLPLARKP